MERLLKKLRDGVLGTSERRRLIGEHERHFMRRVRRLPHTYFRDGDRSEDALRSVSNHAYMWFETEAVFSGLSAFAYVVARQVRAVGFLYTWRGSATMRYLREQGPEPLRQRWLVLRNVRIHLKEAFVPCGRRGGEHLWALPEWGTNAAERRRAIALTALDVPLESARGKAAVRRILTAADMPLTRSEIAAVWIEHQGLDPLFFEDPTDGSAEPIDTDHPEDLVVRKRVRDRAEAFHQRLTRREQALLRARGWGQFEGKLHSFRTASRELGDLGHESCRLMERKILEAFRKEFDDPEERIEAARAFTALIREDPS
jgi:hypothetical protein